MEKFSLQEMFDRSFDKINLPSKGVFYENGQNSFKIRYLSGVEEKVLTSYFLTESGEALEMVLNNLIIDDFEVKDLLVSDLQGIMVFLYSTAYGDKIPHSVKCGNCGANNEITIQLSDIDFKKSEAPIEDGGWFYKAPLKGNFSPKEREIEVYEDGKGGFYLKIKFIPITFGRELEMKKNKQESNAINGVLNSIESVGGIKDREYIEMAIKNMNLRDFKKLKEFSDNNDIALEDNMSVLCDFCGSDNKFRYNFGYDFLRLPEKHKEGILEECFLISHYSESGMNFKEAMNLPISERRWYLNRISQELEKKREAEKKAMDAAKSK